MQAAAWRCATCLLLTMQQRDRFIANALAISSSGAAAGAALRKLCTRHQQVPCAPLAVNPLPAARLPLRPLRMHFRLCGWWDLDCREGAERLTLVLRKHHAENQATIASMRRRRCSSVSGAAFHAGGCGRMGSDYGTIPAGLAGLWSLRSAAGVLRRAASVLALDALPYGLAENAGILRAGCGDIPIAQYSSWGSCDSPVAKSGALRRSGTPARWLATVAVHRRSLSTLVASSSRSAAAPQL
jgi:hypothetical protein